MFRPLAWPRSILLRQNIDWLPEHGAADPDIYTFEQGVMFVNEHEDCKLNVPAYNGGLVHRDEPQALSYFSVIFATRLELQILPWDLYYEVSCCS